ncbi:thermonuclease family protein [Aquimarina aquimarini]|uniref:thermonuclease family protein n=1 Tax=Aquimarina aquimarini TaxID=1191734 RepID=UPI000D559B4A|nr:thermonuclease family protein [Aquimarina aquimarini]
MYTYKATIIRWIDGDTLQVEIDLGFYVQTTQKIRLARIDAPEMNNTVAYRERQAKHARAVAKKFCPEGAIITITTTKQNKDQYARYIAEVTYNNTNMSDYLIDKNVAKLWKG